MIEFARAFFNIALLRLGPQALPASRFLFALLVAATLLLVLGVSFGFGFDVLQMVKREILALAFGLTLTLAVLSIAGRRARFLQVAIAMLGTALVLAPIDVVLLLISGAVGSPADPPDWVHALEVVDLAWGVIISGHVYRCALERSLVVGVLLALACEIMVASAVEGLFPIKP